MTAVVTSRLDDASWEIGRADMMYRDLFPERFGGRLIASHIRIPDGGPTSDYVHFHSVRFMVIYCVAGWARLVYEDQGEPFVFRAGDCVLQPPRIRHQVLESSAGLEVVELACPAEYPTAPDPAMTLPTATVNAERDFGGQRFVWNRAKSANWQRVGDCEVRDLGIEAATDGVGAARVLRGAHHQAPPCEFRFQYLLAGRAELDIDGVRHPDLAAGDAIASLAGANVELRGNGDLERLEVTIPTL